jgi:Arc/MetJ family transcription regulator
MASQKELRIESALFMMCIFRKNIHIKTMRTNIIIDDQLMQDALRATGLKTKRETVELGLHTLVRLKQQENIRELRGKLAWEGDLNAMRTDQ